MRALGALKALPSLTPEVGPQSENVFSSPNPFSPRSGHTATNHLPPSAYSPVPAGPGRALRRVGRPGSLWAPLRASRYANGIH